MSSVTAPGLAAIAERHRRRNALALWALAVGFAAIFLLSVGWGAVPIRPGQVLAILVEPLGLDLPWAFETRERTVLLAIRLPRAVLAVLAGAALAVSGAALQGLFRNPMADPALIGVSSGAALAAVGVIVLGIGTGVFGLYALPVAAFIGGLAATVIVYHIASRGGRTEIATMLLAGIAVNAMAGAGIGLMTFLSDDRQLRELNFWLLGGLGGVTWEKLLPAVPLVLLAVAVIPLLARRLNALLLGETEALHLGFHVENTKRLIVTLAALATGGTVALTGVIGFVGLVVPHLVRLLIGPDHRILLPASILLGAGLMLLADLFARTLVLPAELPVGILTSCVGGPFFIWLLVRYRAIGSW